MRLVGVAILAAFGTISVVFSGGCTLLSGADRLTATCDGCDVETTRDNTVPTPAATSPPDGGGVADDTNSNKTTSPASTDASAEASAPTAVPSKNPLECDGATCSGVTPFCCQISNARARCTATAAECTAVPNQAVLGCGKKADCGAGEVCCADASMRTAQCGLASTCTSSNKRALCKGEGDCKNNELCIGPSPMFDHDYCESF